MVLQGCVLPQDVENKCARYQRQGGMGGLQYGAGHVWD